MYPTRCTHEGARVHCAHSAVSFSRIVQPYRSAASFIRILGTFASAQTAESFGGGNGEEQEATVERIPTFLHFHGNLGHGITCKEFK